MAAEEMFALALGAFLGFALLKFGNPVVLDAKVSAPASFSEAWSYAWPPHWSFFGMGLFAVWGALLAAKKSVSWPANRRLWVLAVLWLAWQVFSALETVDRALSGMVLAQFAGCVICYFSGALVFPARRGLVLLLAGLTAAFVFCLVRAVDQKLFEFPQEHRLLLEGERTGWTNFAPEIIGQMKTEGVIISTNGADVANPLIMAKYEKGRVHGTLVYPNALAGAVLLLLPVVLAVVLKGTQRFRKATRLAAIGLILFLGLGSLFWTGSKSGWLLALVMAGTWLFKFQWPVRLKLAVVALVLLFGGAVFAVRFQHYFATGATSVSARFDYWRAAAENTLDHPLLGSGPGTFQRPYALLKRPESEMARLVHNDYLEQFSDSGIPGGLFYAIWILLLLAALGRKVWRGADLLSFALFLGLAGWFAQGLSEFGLYIPALAWTAFALAGGLLKQAPGPRAA